MYSGPGFSRIDCQPAGQHRLPDCDLHVAALPGAERRKEQEERPDGASSVDADCWPKEVRRFRLCARADGCGEARFGLPGPPQM